MAKVSPKTSYTPSRSTKKKATKTSASRSRTEWWEHEGKKAKGVKFCDRCNAVYYNGHWHTSPKMSAALKAKSRSPKHEVCEQCNWILHGKDLSKAGFEGELTLDGLVDPKEKAEIISTVRNAGARATKRDPEDVIIAIDDRGERVVVTTSENQLAVALGKAVDASHKGGKLRITWSDNDLPARVHWQHKAK